MSAPFQCMLCHAYMPDSCSDDCMCGDLSSGIHIVLIAAVAVFSSSYQFDLCGAAHKNNLHRRHSCKPC